MNWREVAARFAIGFASKLLANIVSDELKRRKEKAFTTQRTAKHLRK